MSAAPGRDDHRIVRVDHRLIEAMQEREQQLAEAQLLPGVGSWESDVVAGHRRWSDELYRLFGLETQQFDTTYEGPIARTHPRDRPILEEVMARALTTHQDYDRQHRMVRPDGNVRFLKRRGRPSFTLPALRSASTAGRMTLLTPPWPTRASGMPRRRSTWCEGSPLGSMM